MPLVMGDSGQAYEIKRIGGNDEVRTHLASMGFVPGAKVTLVSVNNGSVIVNQRCAGKENYDLIKALKAFLYKEEEM